MLRNLLFLTILAPGLLAALRSRYAALLLYFWYAFFRPEDYIWMDVSALRLSLLLGTVLVVPALLAGQFPDVRHPLSVGAIVFFGAALVAQANAFDPATGWRWIEFMAKLLLVTLLTTTLVTDRRKFLLAVAVIALSFGFHASKAGLYSLLRGGARFADGFGGAYSDNNGYATAMAMVSPLLLCVAQNTVVRSVRWGCLLALPLVGLGVVATYSRSGFLALIGATFAMIATQQRHRAGLFVAAVCVSIPIGVFITKQEGYLERMQTIRTYREVNETSAVSRTHFWQVAVNMVQSQPLGIGLFNYEAAYDQYDFLDGQYGRKRSVHSSHFQVLAETGIIGAAAWSFNFVFAVWTIRRIRRRASRLSDENDRLALVSGANAMFASMVAFLIGGAFIALALNDLTWISFGLVAALDRLSRSMQPETATEHAAPSRARQFVPQIGMATLASRRVWIDQGSRG